VLFATALVFNVHRPPFDDVRVRQAIDLAIDRERIVTAALAGFATPASGAVSPQNPLAVQRPIVPSPARADSLLDAAGWRRSSNGVRERNGQPFNVQLLTVGSGDNAVEQLVQADLAERGIRVDIRQMELAAFLAQARGPRKSFDMLITGFPGDLSLSYVSAMYESSQRGSAVDYADFHSPVLDALFARARVARTDADRHAAWRDIQDQLAREMPAVWLYHSRGLQGVSARMHNVTMDLRGELATVAQWSTTDANIRLAVRP
jgi:peptide/nickel transport system substrate-binding protein